MDLLREREAQDLAQDIEWGLRKGWSIAQTLLRLFTQLEPPAPSAFDLSPPQRGQRPSRHSGPTIEEID